MKMSQVNDLVRHASSIPIFWTRSSMKLPATPTALRKASLPDTHQYQRPSSSDWERFRAEKRVWESFLAYFEDYDAKIQLVLSSARELEAVFGLCFHPRSSGPAAALGRLGHCSRKQKVARLEIQRRCVARCAGVARCYQQVEHTANANRALATRIAQHITEHPVVHSEQEAEQLKDMINRYCQVQLDVEQSFRILNELFSPTVAQVMICWLESHKQLFDFTVKEATWALEAVGPAGRKAAST